MVLKRTSKSGVNNFFIVEEIFVMDLMYMN